MSAGRAAVLFDLDGTLVSTRDLYMAAYRAAVEPYIRKELTTDEIRALQLHSEIGFIRAVVTETDVPAALEDFYASYGRLHPELFEGIYAGVPAVLDAIRAAGLPVGIVTGKSRRSWEITAAAAALGPFQALVFDDDVPAPKPDPAGIRLALELIGADAASSVYVGDNLSDVRAAVAAGVRPIAALWAREPESRDEYAERAQREGAVVIVAPGELLALLGI